MKKVALVLFLMTFVLVSCSFPKLVKVEDNPDPTATTAPVFPEPTDDVVVPPAPVEETEIPFTQREILLNETFSSDDGTWNLGYWPDNTGVDEITNGEYRMTVYDTTYMIWSKTFDFYTSDLGLEVDARLHAGTDDNGQGFICRYTDKDNFYFLYIGNDGWYSINKFVNDEYESLLSGWAPDGVIDPVVNKIGALCAGDTLTLEVNGQVLGSVQDSSHPYGAVGLFTRTYDTANITIAYDNFIVYDASDAGYGDDPAYDGPMVGDGPIFYEDFEDEDGPWILGDFDKSSTYIEYGWLTYEMRSKTWTSLDVTEEVYASDVNMQAYFSNDSGGTDNQQGFICRYQDDDNYYLISFGSDGYLRLGLRKNGKWEFLLDEYGDASKIDPSFNFVQASFIGNELSLYVGGNLVAQVTDPNYTFGAGDVGLIVGTFDDPNVTISIDDFYVYSLD